MPKKSHEETCARERHIAFTFTHMQHATKKASFFLLECSLGKMFPFHSFSLSRFYSPSHISTATFADVNRLLAMENG